MEAIDTLSPGAKLRALLAEPGIMVAPGVFDGFSLRLVEQMGYKTAAITGAEISESHLGWADVGIMGYAENVQACAALAAVSSIPLAADGDTGYDVQCVAVTGIAVGRERDRTDRSERSAGLHIFRIAHDADIGPTEMAFAEFRHR